MGSIVSPAETQFRVPVKDPGAYAVPSPVINFSIDTDPVSSITPTLLPSVWAVTVDTPAMSTRPATATVFQAIGSSVPDGGMAGVRVVTSIAIAPPGSIVGAKLTTNLRPVTVVGSAVPSHTVQAPGGQATPVVERSSVHGAASVV